jgi:hypothetical protein
VSVLLSFSCSGFSCGFQLCVEMPEYYDCCGKWVWPSSDPEDWEDTWEPAPWAAAEDIASSGRCGLSYRRVIVFWFRFRYVLNSNTSLPMYFFCNSRIHVITLYSGHVCVVLCVNASVLAPRMDLVRIDHPYLGVGHHNWYQSRTSIIRHWRPYFQKPTVRIHFNARIRTIVVLTGGKVTGIYFLYLHSTIYFL